MGMGGRLVGGGSRRGEDKERGELYVPQELLLQVSLFSTVQLFNFSPLCVLNGSSRGTVTGIAALPGHRTRQTQVLTILAFDVQHTLCRNI